MTGASLIGEDSRRLSPAAGRRSSRAPKRRKLRSVLHPNDERQEKLPFDLPDVSAPRQCVGLTVPLKRRARHVGASSSSVDEAISSTEHQLSLFGFISEGLD